MFFLFVGFLGLHMVLFYIYVFVCVCVRVVINLVRDFAAFF